jgi:hypothetical protein
MTLFVSAFDDVFVYRYNQNTKAKSEKIAIRYVNGPKHRVLHDINDRAKTLTLPVVTIEQTSLRRDPTRVFNKDKFLYRKHPDNNRLSKIPTPIPVSMELDVNIICYFKEDLDQIIQNFVVNCNPYIIVSWKIPDDFDLPFIDEVRSEIQWSGDISYDNPKDLSPDTKWRISGQTSFTVKGWLFKSFEQTEDIIYTVRADFINSNLLGRFCTDGYNLSAISGETETVTISAFPEFTNISYFNSNGSFPIYDDFTIKKEYDNGFTLYGKRFDYSNTWYLSSGVPNFYTNFQEITSAKHPTISAYRLPDEYVDVIDGNRVRIELPENSLSAVGNFKFISANEAGWAFYPLSALEVT